MSLSKSLILAVILGLLSIVSWEIYWRSQHRVPNIDDNRDLWAIQRSKLDNLQNNQVAFIGSSRILFDIQKPVWRDEAGTDAIMLGIQGATPLPILRHILEETEFRGLIVVGVAPDIFFWADKEDDRSWIWSQAKLDYHKERTYAQRINHKLSIPLQKYLAFYRDGDEEWTDDVDLRTLLKNFRRGERAGPLAPPFYNFENTHIDRNVEMSAKATKNSALANSVIRAWGLDEWEEEIEDDEDYEKMHKDVELKRSAIISYFEKYAREYIGQGGAIVLVRFPSTGKYRALEERDFPRANFWDSLVIKTKLPAYHFEDYNQLVGLNLPELSHLSKEDADYLTTELIRIFKKDGILTNRNPD